VAHFQTDTLNEKVALGALKGLEQKAIDMARNASHSVGGFEGSLQAMYRRKEAVLEQVAYLDKWAAFMGNYITTLQEMQIIQGKPTSLNSFEASWKMNNARHVLQAGESCLLRSN